MESTNFNKPSNGLVFTIIFAVGISIGIAVNHFLLSVSDDESAGVNEPLYWVAPMDPNFRRDKPGKSPMGMDLVPVYQDDATGNDTDAGIVTISPEVMQNMGVRTAKVTTGYLSPVIDAVGTVQYDENRLLHVHPRIAGWVEKLYIKAKGEKVKQGEPLYELYSPELVNAQEEYLLALNANEKPLVVAAKRRLQALHIPNAHIEKLRTTRKVSQYVLFTAPQSGVIEHLNIREGYYVKPDTTLLSIGNLNSVWVIADVLERQASFLSIGMKAKMTLTSSPTKVWHGEVDYIYPTLDTMRQTLKVRLTLENEEHQLKPNMLASITFAADQTEPFILLPKQALIRTGNQHRVVMALGDGRFKSINVETGAADRHNIAITSGLNDGEEVVISSQFLIDSQSSIDSDFLRMDELPEDLPTARVKGLVNAVDAESRIVNISREAIEKWDRPATTMDFMVDDNFDLVSLAVDKEIDFTFVILDGEFVIVELHSDIDHSAHQHMNH